MKDRTALKAQANQIASFLRQPLSYELHPAEEENTLDLTRRADPRMVPAPPTLLVNGVALENLLIGMSQVAVDYDQVVYELEALRTFVQSSLNKVLGAAIVTGEKPEI